jgi:hypothetical protein
MMNWDQELLKAKDSTSAPGKPAVAKAKKTRESMAGGHTQLKQSLTIKAQ